MPEQTTPRGQRRRRGRLIAGALAIVVALALGGGYWRHQATALHRFSVVHEGRLFRSQALSAEIVVKRCEEHGIRTVVDLRKEEQREAIDAEAEALAAAGVKHIRLSTGQVPDPHVVAQFLEVMDEPANWPVLVHCRHGSGRTGVMAAIYRMEYQGWSNDRARRENVVLPHFSSFDRGERKGEFIMNYVPREKHKPPQPPRKLSAGSPEAVRR